MSTSTRLVKSLTNLTHVENWRAVYDKELPRVYNFFHNLVRDDQLAEDLTAETFNKAWQHRGRYTTELGAISTWLFTIARRTAADYFRSFHPETSLETVESLADHCLPEMVVQSRDDLKRLAALLIQLPEREREMVALKYGAGFTNRSIAEQTGLSETNVGTIFHRVVQKLRDGWEEDHE